MHVNIGFQEIVLIVLVALIFLGPGKMKELASALGKVSREFRRARDRVMDEIEGEKPDIPDSPEGDGGDE